MPKTKKPPDIHKVLISNIKSLCDERGITLEEQRVVMRMSQATYFRRKANPETFTLGELERMATRLSVTVQQLLTKREFMI